MWIWQYYPFVGEACFSISTECKLAGVIWKRAHIAEADIPDVITSGHGWMLVDGNLEPLWYEGDVQFADIITVTLDTTNDDSDSQVDIPRTEKAEYVVDGADTDSDLD